MSKRWGRHPRYCFDGLYAFQAEGVIWLLDHTKGLLADEQGLGKTVQVARALESDPSIAPVTVVCPAHLVRNWERELRRWAPSRYPLAMDRKITHPPLSDVIPIVSYDRYRSTEFLSQRGGMLIVDEAHYIKNTQAKRTKAVLDARSDGVWALTGTPVMNRPDELFAIAKLLRHPLGKSKRAFMARYTYHDHWGRIRPRTHRLAELGEAIADIALRRLKEDVLDQLPAKTRSYIAYDLHAGEFQEEQRIIAQMPGHFDFARLGSKAYLDWRSHIATARRKSAVVKVDSVCRYAKDQLDSGEEKLVLWWHHREAIEKAQAELHEYRPIVLWGGQSPKKRQEAVDRFWHDDGCRVAIASLTAANTGLNLHVASRAVFGELDWVPANLFQAEDRLHRIGQTKPCWIDYVVARGSFDDLIAQVIVEKEAVVSEIMAPLEQAQQLF